MGRSTKIFGEKIAKARSALHLTQAELGEKVGGMSDENIGRIERSHIAGILSKRIPQLAAALQIPIDVFERDFVVKDPPLATASTISKVIRSQLQGLGWSVRDLAKQTGYSVVMLTPIVNGTAFPQPAVYKKINEAFGRGFEKFLSESEDDESETGK